MKRVIHIDEKELDVLTHLKEALDAEVRRRIES